MTVTERRTERGTDRMPKLCSIGEPAKSLARDAVNSTGCSRSTPSHRHPPRLLKRQCSRTPPTPPSDGTAIDVRKRRERRRISNRLERESRVLTPLSLLWSAVQCVYRYIHTHICLQSTLIEERGRWITDPESGSTTGEEQKASLVKRISMDGDRRRTPNSNQKKRLGRANEKAPNQRPENGLKGAKGKGNVCKGSVAKADSSVVSDTNLGTETPEVYANMVIHYVDDVIRSDETSGNTKASISASRNDVETLGDSSLHLDKESNQDKEVVSDSDTARDSVSSQGEEKVRGSSERASTKKSYKSGAEPSSVSTVNSSNGTLKDMELPAKPSSGSSEGIDHKPAEAVKEVDVLDEASHGTQSAGSEDETSNAEGSGEFKHEEDLEHKIKEMETRIEKLEGELREVAALEVSLYSVVPEHGSSAHKVHTPARRLSRLYIHACKHWTQGKRGTIAKNTVSGLVLISRSCSNDVPRLTFWLSNIIVLRETISQAFGSSRSSSPFTRFAESDRTAKTAEGKSTLNRKGASNGKPKNGFMQVPDDWQEAGTFLGALEKIEFWIFSRIVESIWWQALMPYVQTPDGNSSSSKFTGRLLGPALGDQQQGSFSIDLWRDALQDAFHRLCPVRAGGHECGCLPVLARMVIKQCVMRLDVAMFNAILRESAHEIPTDPVSDPIVDSKVLPIPAGNLSFGSGAQLKNSVGNWSRWIADALGADTDDAVDTEHSGEDDEYKQGGNSDPKPFILLNELSDLLMLPKDMLMDRSIRKEVCPSITLTLVKRILCNFTPDEFCPDAVPGAVLEALNAESIFERRFSGETTRNFPYVAAPVVYFPPSSADVAEKVAEAGERSPLSRSVSIVQRKGYTSDEELEDLDCPLTSIIDKLQTSPVSNGNGKHIEHAARASVNARYDLLREVWSM